MAGEQSTAAGYIITSQELLEAYKTKMAAMSSDELANVAGGKGKAQRDDYTAQHTDLSSDSRVGDAG